jgi:hypothetical protein
MRSTLVVTAALAISFASAGIALADSVTITRTGVDEFGNTRRISQTVDNLGNRRVVYQRESDNGFVRCKTVTVRSSNGMGDSASRTMRRCAPDF